MSLRSIMEEFVMDRCGEISHIYALLDDHENVIGDKKNKPCLGWLVKNLDDADTRNLVHKASRLLIWPPDRYYFDEWSFSDDEAEEYYHWLLHESEYKDYFVYKDWKEHGLQVSLHLPTNLIMFLTTLARLPYEWERSERQENIRDYKYNYDLSWEQAIVLGYVLGTSHLMFLNTEQGLLDTTTARTCRISDFIHRKFISKKDMSPILYGVNKNNCSRIKGVGVQAQFNRTDTNYLKEDILKALGSSVKLDPDPFYGYTRKDYDLSTELAIKFIRSL